ncbi:matrixin family metalloprotease [archaeon]|nr:matrixin family metalloprotease [archaeon]
MEQICRATVSDDNSVQFKSAVVNGSTLQDMIEDDKKYGVMAPRNGTYFTYQVMDWEGKWISNEKIRDAVTFTWNKVEKVLDLEFKEAKDDEYADFKVYFRRVADDPLLDKNTLMYHFYPIASFDNENRGVCVVNTDYDWSASGKSIPLHIYDPEHYPKPTTSTVKIFDFDAIYEHEGPGHGLGLPHSPNKNTKMFGNESGMIESMFDEDPSETVPRLQAKYPKKQMKESWLRRWINWFKSKRDRY